MTKPSSSTFLDLVVNTPWIPQAKTTVAPLDRVKILFQASNPDYRKYSGMDMLTGVSAADPHLCAQVTGRVCSRLLEILEEMKASEASFKAIPPRC